VQSAGCDQQGKVLGDVVSAQARVLPDREWDTLKSRVQWRAPAPVRFIFNCIRDLRAVGNVYLEITVG
jgi:hypothetical protein